jgi:CheY-like chemotaxis protein
MTTDKPILLVDDDADFLAITQMVLEKAGYRVRTADNPRAAWDWLTAAAESERPALVITDLMMSHLDSGFSFARQIKDDPRFASVPIIIATAVSSTMGLSFRPRTDSELMAMRVDAYFDKPVSPKALVAKVAELLGLSPPA